MPGSTVLVIEDNTIQREGLAAVLRQQGFTVLTAENGHDALNCLSSSIPNIILLDMLMPNGDGWWFLEQRKSLPALSFVPVIITTALAVAGGEWASSLGAAGLLRKPFDAEPLLAEINRCLEGTGRG
jgi:twitching motility two-component system response regulator PilH